MLPRLGGPALPLLPPLLLLLLGAGGGGRGARAEVLFRCPPCTSESLAACKPPPAAQPAAEAGPAGDARVPCELVREPGCGCCSVCARLEGERCGVYTPRCGQGLRCYPHPGSELPLRALVHGEGTCEKHGDAEYSASPEQVAAEHTGACTSETPSLASFRIPGLAVTSGSEPWASGFPASASLLATLEPDGQGFELKSLCSKGNPKRAQSAVADNGEDHSEGGLVENHVDGNMNLLGGGGGAGRKPLKSGMKDLQALLTLGTKQLCAEGFSAPAAKTVPFVMAWERKNGEAGTVFDGLESQNVWFIPEACRILAVSLIQAGQDSFR
ncbi:insulin-like growth factor-binding protein 2 [Physeter macrocephalus]|uniref:Insulin-like growth factor-binding protein 2 n=1 Tax=Physeter macrocephalus TaxID=9755 RepID=A0A9W2W8B2_PHYMC|nr:insulin-like growth factor-binding protein 2 [Physeter catodon]